MHAVGNVGFGLFIAAAHAVVGMLAMRSLISSSTQVVGHAAHFTAITPQASVVATEMAGRVAGEN
jgi:hypothetical protein